jgi:hypothetical protein
MRRKKQGRASEPSWPRQKEMVEKQRGGHTNLPNLRRHHNAAAVSTEEAHGQLLQAVRAAILAPPSSSCRLLARIRR